MRREMLLQRIGAREPGLVAGQRRQGLLEFLPHQAGRNPGLAQLQHDFLVLLERLRTQLAHVAEQGQLAGGLDVAEVLQRGAHRRRIGVVGVHDQGIRGRAHHLRAVVVGDEFRYRGDGVGARHAEILAYRQGGQDVGGVVGADEVRDHERVAQADAQEGFLRRGRQDLGALIVNAVAEGMAGLLGRHFPQVGIVLVQEDERAAVRAEPVVELPFRGLDALEGAEAQQVRPADVGDQAVVRLADFHKLGDIVGVVGAHLDHGDLRVGGDGQQRKRHADVVVEIALRGRDAVFLRQHGGDEVLGGGLAVRARQAEHGQFAVPHVRAVPDGQLLQGLERVRDLNKSGFAGQAGE